MDTCRELGIAVVVYSPLERGLLIDSIKISITLTKDLDEGDFRSSNPKFLKKIWKVISFNLKSWKTFLRKISSRCEIDISEL